MRRLFALVLPVLLGACLGACASSRPAATGSASMVPDLENRAFLLFVVDRQAYEPMIVQQALAGGPELREALAVALGRIPDPQVRSPLVGLLLAAVRSFCRSSGSSGTLASAAPFLAGHAKLFGLT